MWLLYFLTCHFVADFVLQTHWQASNKCKNNVALFCHVFTYSIFMNISLFFYMVILPVTSSLNVPSNSFLNGNGLAFFIFGFVTFFTHFVTDYCTSRVTSKLWAKQDWHNFFVVVGFDQLIHFYTLAFTVYWLGIISK